MDKFWKKNIETATTNPVEKESLDSTPEENAHMEILVKEEIEKSKQIVELVGQKGSIKNLEPSKLAKLINLADRYKVVLVGLGLLTTAGIAITDAFINRKPNFEIPLNAGDLEIIGAGFTALVGLCLATKDLTPLPGYANE